MRVAKPSVTARSIRGPAENTYLTTVLHCPLRGDPFDLGLLEVSYRTHTYLVWTNEIGIPVQVALENLQAHPHVRLIEGAVGGHIYGGGLRGATTSLTSVKDNPASMHTWVWGTDTSVFQTALYDNCVGAFPFAQGPDPVNRGTAFSERPLDDTYTQIIGPVPDSVYFPTAWQKKVDWPNASDALCIAQGQLLKSNPLLPPANVWRKLYTRPRKGATLTATDVYGALVDPAYGRDLAREHADYAYLYFFMESSPTEQAQALRTVLKKPALLNTVRECEKWARPLAVEVLDEIKSLRGDYVVERLRQVPHALMKQLKKHDAYAAWLFKFPKADLHLRDLLAEPPATYRLYRLAALRQFVQSLYCTLGGVVDPTKSMTQEILRRTMEGVKDRMQVRFPHIPYELARTAIAAVGVRYLREAGITMPTELEIP